MAHSNPPATQGAPAAPPEGTGKGLAVERLAHKDIPEICALYKRVSETFRSEFPAEIVKAWQPTPLEFTSWMEGVTYFCARQDGRLIGAIGCRITDGSCRLVHFAVDPDSRRKGVATALAHSAVEWARHNAIRSIWVDPLARFAGASELFRRLGFTEAGTLHQHYFAEDVRLFEKLL